MNSFKEEALTSVGHKIWKHLWDPHIHTLFLWHVYSKSCFYFTILLYEQTLKLSNKIIQQLKCPFALEIENSWPLKYKFLSNGWNGQIDTYSFYIHDANLKDQKNVNGHKSWHIILHNQKWIMFHRGRAKGEPITQL